MSDNIEKISLENKPYSLDELVRYEYKIKSLAREKSSELIFNDSIVHAALIMSEILENSTSVNMYCGEFSYFRNSFKEKLDDMFKNPVYDEVRDTPKFNAFDPYQKTVDALESFLERGGKMRVIMQQDDPISLTKEVIWQKFLKKYYQERSIDFYKFDIELKLYHFTVGDNEMYRQESDMALRTAFACFNNEKNATLLNTTFEILKKNASVVNLN